MVEIACEADPLFEASRAEEGPETSYSIDTIERLEPDYFLIGADAFAEIRSWRRWEDIVRAVTFIVVSRPGAVYDIPAGARVERLEDFELPISSSEIRRRLKMGDPDVPVPEEVARYIHEHALYR
jgi:nicotinate-nucleotide adenylyltransferase